MAFKNNKYLFEFQKQQLQGEMYDYIFGFDLGKNVGLRQLGFNTGDNEYAAAQDFIAKEESLNQTYLEIIARFIGKNVEVMELTIKKLIEQLTSTT